MARRLTRPQLSAAEERMWRDGTLSTLHESLGAFTGASATTFAVWAPHATSVAVKGIGWQRSARRSANGTWRVRVPGVAAGERYRFIVESGDGQQSERLDPMGRRVTDDRWSVVNGSTFSWRDGSWMRSRHQRQTPESPITVYEVHLGSWRRAVDGSFLDYRTFARELADHVVRLGFTHVELLPVMEHPFYGSWGYQGYGYFAPTHRYGAPDDLKWAIDHLHRRGIGVILDWVPSHFPDDAEGLFRFDGTALYEHADSRRGWHPDWQSAIFDYDRGEVRSFLLSSARYWLEEFHADGLRVDAVASMLYLDYSRNDGEWLPNEHGGNENLGAYRLFRDLAAMVDAHVPDALLIAEESTAWPGVTRPVHLGGLGFDYKWDMGWMHDTLQYMERDPVHRSHHHDELTFRGLYAGSERFMLALSHDEVVHLKGSLLTKMPGDRTAQLSNLRLLLSYMWALPGKQLLFMGAELAQDTEWAHDGQLPWHLATESGHAGIGELVATLNQLMRSHSPLHEFDHHPDGFAWIDPDDRDMSTVSFVRRDASGRSVVFVANFSAAARSRVPLGVPEGGRWRTVLSSDARQFGGQGRGHGRLHATATPRHGFDHSLKVDLPPLTAAFLVPSSGG